MSVLLLSPSLYPHSSCRSLSPKLSALDLTWAVIYIRCGVTDLTPLTHISATVVTASRSFPSERFCFVKPSSLFRLYLYEHQLLCVSVIFHGFVTRSKKKRKGVLLPRRKVQRSHRNAIPAPTGASELLDVMMGRRWRLMPLRSKYYRSMKQKVWQHIVWKYTILGDESTNFFFLFFKK